MQIASTGHTPFIKTGIRLKTGKTLLLLPLDWQSFTTHCLTLPPAGKRNNRYLNKRTGNKCILLNECCPKTKENAPHMYI